MKLEAHELQALIRYHCMTVVDSIDDDGIKPSQQPKLLAVWDRIRQLFVDLGNCPVEDLGP